MTTAPKLFPFILLIIGTFGLLINEFIFDWGTIATLIFALSNLMGLIILAFASRSKKKDR